MRNILGLLIVLILLISCTNNLVFDQYKSMPNAEWHKDSIVKFEFNPIDTVSRNNLYINLRNNNDYGYSNLFLIVGIDFPNNYKVVDTLEYEMTDAEGKFLGEGFTDLKENPLEFKTNVIFPTTGTYTFSIQHAMRKSGEVDGITLLNGVTDVGLKIEKMNTND
ncbi:gliding motility lipoprotein GldH [Aureibaculum sp. 2210JD6-5]|uniref:gliding motility lipoprotein GldH n=1 Tax=Aureibaculum sp. 2210JD6-5 TaxID=3103957 RepID=UPI002AAD2313|nr:gliding motility lipoprotein GldH [Aureibaculum sp. 2210JD6-5]MDY7396545.1 gliding motility lipoprotein GldH [Aureibaculum sp. 2210JD6-5]